VWGSGHIQLERKYGRIPILSFFCIARKKEDWVAWDPSGRVQLLKKMYIISIFYLLKHDGIAMLLTGYRAKTNSDAEQGRSNQMRSASFLGLDQYILVELGLPSS
jgi:hypothetical protein